MVGIADNLKKIKVVFFAWAVICLLTMVEIILTNTFQTGSSPEKINDISLTYALPIIRFASGSIAIIIVLFPSYLGLRNKPLTIKVIGAFVMSFMFSILYLVTFVFLNSLIFYRPTEGHVWESVLNLFYSNLHHGVTYYLFLILILFSIDYLIETSLAIIKKEKVERKLMASQFTILKNQLQPHFLFNALNSITTIIDEEKAAAQQMVIDLSELLRKSLDLDYSKEHTLEQEVKILHTYLSIEKARFEHQLEVIEEFDQEALSRNIIPFVFQPLVENAIKHGFTAGAKMLTIKISIKCEEDRLQLEVANNGKELEDCREQVGLNNLSSRLSHQYGEQFDFELIQLNEWVVNRVTIHRI